MTEERAQRRLAAILAADVVGYSRLMERDEAGTLATLKTRRKNVLQPLVGKHHGRIAKVMGDGVLVEFSSAVNAVECAVELQAAMQAANMDLPDDRQIVLRIGINLGDIMVEGSDLYGDGVNIASRLQGLSEVGGLCISGNVLEHVSGKLPYSFAALGPQTLKNIERPIQVYRLATSAAPKGRTTGIPLPDRPSIAVLPFDNMSGDPEQEYFADGMVEEIITALSRFHELFVIARNSSFTYKGRAVDVKQIGRELGVRYILEGSVRKAGDRVRITGQLVDSSTGVHLWANRFDGQLEDIFDLQDQVTTSVVGAIAPKLTGAEIERAKRKPTESLDAYDYFLRGMSAFNQWARDANNEALSMFYKAIELDPQFAAAYGMAARCFSQRKGGGWIVDRIHEINETERLSRRAAELGKDDAVALSAAGISLTFVVGDPKRGSDLIDRALALNPNLGLAWVGGAWAAAWCGDSATAIERVARAMRLNPYDAQTFGMETIMATAHFFAGRYDEALSWAEKALREQANSFIAISIRAASCAFTGHLAEAKESMARLLQLEPGLRVATLKDALPIQRPKDLEKFCEGLRLAGLPE